MSSILALDDRAADRGVALTVAFEQASAEDGLRLKLESHPGTGTVLQVWFPDFEHRDSRERP